MMPVQYAYMFHKITTILLWSQDYERLARWYQDVFKVKVIEQLDHPNDTGILMEFPDGQHGSGQASIPR